MKQYPHMQWRMGPCFYCGAETYRAGPGSNLPNRYTRDHLIPKRLRVVSLTDLPATVRHLFTVPCCLQCNRAKGAQTVVDFVRKKKYSLSKAKRKLIRKAYSFNRRNNAAVGVPVPEMQAHA